MTTQLMQRILTPNIIECIKSDIEWFGVRIVGERYRSMTVVKTLNNEFSIQMDRIDCKLWKNNSTFNYICTMSFRNNLGLEILKLNFSEYDAAILIDNLCQFEDFNMKDVIIPINSVNGDMNNYQIKIERIESDLLRFTILQYNILYGNIVIPKLTFMMTTDELSNNFLYGIYFSYLIDIDCGDISLMESIYSRIVEQC